MEGIPILIRQIILVTPWSSLEGLKTRFHYSNVMMNTMASQITTVLIVQAEIKENIKASDRWIPTQRASNAEMFPFDDVIMFTVCSAFV